MWCFFHGTLADPAVLTRLLSLPDAESPVLVPASILIGSWKGKYKALVDGASTDRIHGSADKVTSREQEDASLTYEMENYEVTKLPYYNVESNGAGTHVQVCRYGVERHSGLAHKNASW